MIETNLNFSSRSESLGSSIRMLHISLLSKKERTIQQPQVPLQMQKAKKNILWAHLNNLVHVSVLNITE